MVEITKISRESGAEESDESIPEELRPLLGKYILPAAGLAVTVLFQDNSLAVEIPGLGTLKVKRKTGGNRWINEDKKEYEFFFEFDDSGAVTAINISHTYILPREE